MNARRQQVTLQPDVLRWARERGAYEYAEIARKIGVKQERVEEWEETGKISIAQIGRLADHTYTPLGLLYLSDPPINLDELTIPDFRTRDGRAPQKPSPNLLETVHTMQRRQSWMREELLRDGFEALPFVGSFNLANRPDEVARAMKSALNLSENWAAEYSTWEDALRYLVKRFESAGVLTMFNGVVGNNTHRKLEPKEFQGFALVDKYAPLVFINGADYKAAQMFTVAHELAHIFIAKSGLSQFENLQSSQNKIEKFCDQAAAEFLVPRAELVVSLDSDLGLPEQCQEIAKHFKVSTIVAARRMLDIELINLDAFFNFYNERKVEANRRKKQEDGGGNFWNTQNVRIGHPFGVTIWRAVSEGRLFYRDAYNLTGLKGKTFDKFMRNMDMREQQ